ncbi:MAG: hypothetical protein D6813_15825 [Calditrichaeota bacterium]|nr:MAG: hypothetical protein D6813_15825 [Calditrichota bacterium]
MDDGVLEILIKLLADAVILISQFEVTRLKEAKEKVDLLKRLNVPIIGVIINQKKSYIPKFLGKMLGYENSDDC